VRWYLMGIGTEVDLHTPHWHGQTATVMGMRHVNDHSSAGMSSLFDVSGSDGEADEAASGRAHHVHG
jgi:hypothetical protein